MEYVKLVKLVGEEEALELQRLLDVRFEMFVYHDISEEEGWLYLCIGYVVIRRLRYTEVLARDVGSKDISDEKYKPFMNIVKTMTWIS